MRRVALASLVLAGCSSELVAPIEFDEATETVVFRRDACGEEERPTLFVATPETLDLDFRYCEGLALALHEYSEPADALCLTPGILPNGVAPLVVPDHARTGALGAHGIDWDDAPKGERTIEDLVVPELDVEACAMAGQCIGPSSACTCRDTCAAPSFDGVNAPEPPSTACAEGWGAVVVRPDLTACRAFEPDLACAQGEVPIPGEGCRMLLSECVGAEWPVGFADLYVRASAQGVGSMADPLGSLEGALAIARPGDVIALAPGVYALQGTIDVDDLTIVGTCPGEVTIENVQRSSIRSSGFALRDLTVDLKLDVMSLQETGTMSLERVALIGTQVLDLRGDALIRDSVVSAVTRVVGATSLETSYVDASLRVRGRLETRRVTLAPRASIPLLATEAESVALLETYVAASTVAIDMTVGGVLAIVRSHVEGAIVAYADTTTITATYLETTSLGATVGRCVERLSTVVLADVVVVGEEGEEPAFTGLCSKVDVDRLAVVGGEGLWFTHSEVGMHDVQVLDSADNGVTFVGSPRVDVDRLVVNGAHRVGVAVDDNWPGHDLQGGILEFVDVLVEDSREAAARFDDTKSVTIRKSRFTDSGGNGLVFAPNSTVLARIVLDDVRIERTRGDRLCGVDGTMPCEGAGLYLYGDLGVGQVELLATDVESTAASAALNIVGKARLVLSRVRFSDSKVGAYINAPTIPRETFVSDVVYSGNERAIEFVQ